jgi:DMSO/TMAO reductase YedYZ molybdopterin-dependent catalytic subunit
MSTISRRRLITTGIAAIAGASGLEVVTKLGARHGLLPPDAGVLYGAGETLTYAAQRILIPHSLAREFPRSRISKAPFANEVSPLGKEFHKMQQTGFKDWRLTVDGMVGHPASFTLSDLKSFPTRSQITSIACEEGWSYIAEWSGVPLSHILEVAGTAPQARYVVYHSIQPDWWDSIDIADALHPQTLIALRMNGADLPVPFGGPIRLRVPRQLGYKRIKYLVRLTVTDNLKTFGKGLGSGVEGAESGYAWYAGI